MTEPLRRDPVDTEAVDAKPVDTEAVDAKPVAGEPATTGRIRRLTAWATPRFALRLAAVMMLVAVVIGVFAGQPYFAERDRADQAAAALAAGKQVAVNFVTMDYRTFDAYGARVLGSQ